MSHDSAYERQFSEPDKPAKCKPGRPRKTAMLETELGAKLGAKRGYQTTADKINSRADELEKAAKKRYKGQQKALPLPGPPPVAPPKEEPAPPPGTSRTEHLRVETLLNELDYWLDDYTELLKLKPAVSALALNGSFCVILDKIKETVEKARQSSG